MVFAALSQTLYTLTNSKSTLTVFAAQSQTLNTPTDSTSIMTVTLQSTHTLSGGHWKHSGGLYNTLTVSWVIMIYDDIQTKIN
jgi:hypothetical protein